MAKAKSLGIEDLTGRTLSEEELKSLEEQIGGDRNQVVLGVPLYGQTNGGGKRRYIKSDENESKQTRRR